MKHFCSIYKHYVMLLLNNKNNIVIIKHGNNAIIDPPVGPRQGFLLTVFIRILSLVHEGSILSFNMGNSQKFQS